MIVFTVFGAMDKPLASFKLVHFSSIYILV